MIQKLIKKIKKRYNILKMKFKRNFKKLNN